MRTRRSITVIVAAAALVAAGCGDSADPPASAVLTAAPTPGATDPTSTTSTTDGEPTGTTVTTAPASTTTLPSLEGVAVPPSLDGLPLTLVSVNEELLVVAVADSGGARQQGLMNVDDLRDLDGMLFAWPDDTDGGFWMKNTLLPLDIAFFTVNGAFVDTFPMEPCTESPCPLYFAAGAYRYALETEHGRLGPLNETTALVFIEQ